MSNYNSLTSSVDAVRQIYIFLLTLGISTAIGTLFVIPTNDSSFLVFYCLFFISYFSLVVQFLIGGMCIVDSVNVTKHETWKKRLPLALFALLALGGALLYLGHSFELVVDNRDKSFTQDNLRLSGFLLGYTLLVASDAILIFILHWPLQKLQNCKSKTDYLKFLLWFVIKVIVIHLSFFEFFGWNNLCLVALDSSISGGNSVSLDNVEVVSKTHYWWLSANLVSLLLIVEVILDPFDLMPKKTFGIDNAIVFLPIILLVFFVLNILKNKRYFFDWSEN